MVSKIEPDRYANTGFSVKDTPVEINDRIFQAMMALTPAERFLKGLSMTATARALTWSGIPAEWPQEQRRAAFCKRFYGPTFKF